MYTYVEILDRGKVLMVGMKSESSSNHLKSASLDCPSCQVASNGELLATMIFWETRKSDMGLSLGQLGF